MQKCDNSAFCKRLRGVQSDSWSISPDSVSVKGSDVHAVVVCGESKQELDLTLTAYDGIARLHVNEVKDSGKQRFQVPHALLPDVDSKAISWAKHDKSSNSIMLKLGEADVTLQYSPLQLDVSVGGKPAISFNSKQLFNFEHLRQKQVGANMKHACTWTALCHIMPLPVPSQIFAMSCHIMSCHVIPNHRCREMRFACQHPDYQTRSMPST